MLDAVIAVISKGEKVLLIQRAPGIRGGGYWAPVSGEVEAGESQEAAVEREAMEYVGGELTLNPAEVSDARWLTVDEVCRLDGTFEGDRDFYRQILPSLAFSNE
jgi:8-oxo-dGTP diphosphatase